MARVYEYQGKEAIKRLGIQVPQGRCVSKPEEARRVAEELGGAVVIKAQVWTTGRSAAGGIKFANSPAETEKVAAELLGYEVKGLKVEKVLVEERLDIEKEFYAGITISDSIKVKGPVALFSSRGGIGIEEVAASNPEEVATVPIDYLEGMTLAKARTLVSSVAFNGKPPGPEVIESLAGLICKLYEAFTKYDARSIEVNPLVLTRDGALVAADCHLVIDDNSVFRHPDFGIKVPRDMERPPTHLEELAWKIEEGDYRGTAYFTQMVPKIEGSGWLGFHGIGGGGTMLAASAFIARGFKIANYADTSGDPTASKIYKVIKCILMQPIDGYVLMGACLANQEQWHHAHAIVKVFKEEAPKRPGFPVVILLAGNKEREAHEIIRTGFKDLPLRWELYGREYIYNTDFLADRVKALVEEYQQEEGSKGESKDG